VSLLLAATEHLGLATKARQQDALKTSPIPSLVLPLAAIRIRRSTASILPFRRDSILCQRFDFTLGHETPRHPKRWEPHADSVR
jgi:hypothetical protein